VFPSSGLDERSSAKALKASVDGFVQRHGSTLCVLAMFGIASFLLAAVSGIAKFGKMAAQKMCKTRQHDYIVLATEEETWEISDDDNCPAIQPDVDPMAPHAGMHVGRLP
jgi:hypothetical protein